MRKKRGTIRMRNGVMSNCHGCKWLDCCKTAGNGYCAMVVRSKNYRGQYIENGELIPSSSVRTESMERCELYEEGNWETRWQKK